MKLVDFYEIVINKSDMWDLRVRETDEVIRLRSAYFMYDPIDSELKPTYPVVLFYDKYYREGEEYDEEIFHVTYKDIEMCYYDDTLIQHPLWTLQPLEAVPKLGLL